MRRIQHCANTILSEINRQAEELITLNGKISAYLPEALRAHCRVGSFSQGQLVLVTYDPVWASQIRYHLPELRNQLRSHLGLYQLSTIKIKVVFENITEPPKKIMRKPISAQAREAMLQTAQYCSDSSIKEALLRLANTVHTPSEGSVHGA